ncbi:DUF3846 domain-containing protein [Streptomyces sp. NPDC047065]|uniref:DUF3846 domain-containing protein n=1 Tax=Streptomyces sp. NPDC047065 TaxID=3154606 RepID=UPI0033E09235
MSTSTAERQYALVVRVDGNFELIDWPTKSGNTLNTLYKAIECERVDVVDVTSRFSMWLDDEGLANGAPINEYASRLYGLYQPLHQPYWGNVVFTGGPDAEGDTLGLNLDQTLELMTRYLDILVKITNAVDLPDFPRPKKPRD